MKRRPGFAKPRSLAKELGIAGPRHRPPKLTPSGFVTKPKKGKK
jgi:hypothetical protein